jgi:hypothetical protein
MGILTLPHGSSNLPDIKSSRLRQKSVLIAVMSAPGNERQREVVRQTWMRRASQIAPLWSTVFVVGRPGQPTELKGDILYVDLEDAYEHLPRKTYALLNWFIGNSDYELLFKTDDDCYVNIFELADFAPSESQYFGHKSGSRRHKPDYHFGRTAKEAVADVSTYDGPWASGSGYCLDKSAASAVVSHTSPVEVEKLVFEDKMVGDALRNSGIRTTLAKHWSALYLEQFLRYETKSDGFVVAPQLRFGLRPLMPRWKVYHLGAAGGAKPLYRVDAKTIALIASKLDRTLHMRWVVRTAATRLMWWRQ